MVQSVYTCIAYALMISSSSAYLTEFVSVFCDHRSTAELATAVRLRFK